MEQRFGNIMHGEVNEMLVSFVGEDMFLSFVGKTKDETYKKSLSRLFKEDDKSDLSALCLTDDKSVAKVVFDKILPNLQDKYALSTSICDFLKDFVCRLYEKFIKNMMPILDSCLNYDEFCISDNLEKTKQNFNAAFTLIMNQNKSLTDFYNVFPNEETIKNSVNRMKCKGESPS